MLDKNQIDFLLENFFKNEKYPGWRNIAEKLIINGSCIVAGDNSLWIGGIGNFIQSKKAENAIGCTELTFNTKEFISLDNEYFKSVFLNRLEIAQDEVAIYQTKVDSLENLVQDQI